MPGPDPVRGTVDLERPHRQRPTDAIDVEPAVALEGGQGAGRRRAEDAVDATAVEAQPAQPSLQRPDVVAAHVRGDQLEVSVTEPPRRLDQGQPGRLVAGAVVVEAAMALEGLHGSLGRRAELTSVDPQRAEAGRAEAALQIADGVAALTEGQREETRNSSSSWSSWDLPLAPTTRLCTSPPWKTSSVGMLITL